MEGTIALNNLIQAIAANAIPFALLLAAFLCAKKSGKAFRILFVLGCALRLVSLLLCYLTPGPDAYSPFLYVVPRAGGYTTGLLHLTLALFLLEALLLYFAGEQRRRTGLAALAPAAAAAAEAVKEAEDLTAPEETGEAEAPAETEEPAWLAELTEAAPSAEAEAPAEMEEPAWLAELMDLETPAETEEPAARDLFDDSEDPDAQPEEAKPVILRICRNCGRNLRPTAVFCPGCGIRLRGEEEEKAMPEPEPQPEAIEAVPMPEPQPTETEPTPVPEVEEILPEPEPVPEAAPEPLPAEAAPEPEPEPEPEPAAEPEQPEPEPKPEPKPEPEPAPEPAAAPVISAPDRQSAPAPAAPEKGRRFSLLGRRKASASGGAKSCPNCGCRVLEGSEFCSFCGATIRR